MKLLSVMTRHPVRRPGDLTPNTFYTAKDYDLVFEQGIVTIKSGKGITLVPLSNIQDMIPITQGEAKK